MLQMLYVNGVYMSIKGSSSYVHQCPLLYKSVNDWANQICDNSDVSAGTELVINEFGSYVFNEIQ
jgi:hypothetical protein